MGTNCIRDVVVKNLQPWRGAVVATRTIRAAAPCRYSMLRSVIAELVADGLLIPAQPKYGPRKPGRPPILYQVNIPPPPELPDDLGF